MTTTTKTCALAIVVIGLGLGLGGCANVPREAGFDEVRATVAERTGGQRIRWYQGGKADAQVAKELRRMLEGELTADEAVQVALLSNRRLQATYEDLMVAQTDLVAAGLLRNPIFEAEVRFLEAGGGESFEIAIVQEFLGVFQIPLRKRIAAARFEAAKQRVAGEVIDLAAEVREAYYRLVTAKQLLELRGTVLEATEAAYAMARRLHEAGNITDLELNLQRAAYEQAKLDLVDAEYQVIDRRETLNAVMGLWGAEATAWEAPDHLPEMPEALDGLEDLERRVVSASLGLAATRQGIEAAGQRLGLERTFGLVPEFEAGAIGEREPEGEWAVGPVFELPIPLFNQGQPQVAAAMAELRRSRAEYFAQATELRTAARAARALLQNARARVRYYQKVLLPLREQVVEQTQLQYNAMQIGVFELLQARRQQIETGVAYIDALREYWLARSAVQTLLSGGRQRVEVSSVEPAASNGDQSMGGDGH